MDRHQSIKEELPSVINQLWNNRQCITLDPERELCGYLLDFNDTKILAMENRFPIANQNVEYLNQFYNDFPMFAYGYGTTYQSKNYILLEYIQGMTLQQAVNSLPLSDIWKYMNIVLRQAKVAFDKFGCVHGDLHMGNVILRPLGKTYNVLGIPSEYFPVWIDYSDIYLSNNISDMVMENNLFLSVSMDELNERELIPEDINAVDYMNEQYPLPEGDYPIYP